MSSPFPHYNSIEEWRELASLPDNEEEHPKFSKSVVERIAEKNGFDDPNTIHVFWVAVSIAAHDYARLEKLDFNKTQKTIRAETAELLKTLQKATDQIQCLKEETRRYLEFSHVGLHLANLDEEAEEQSLTLSVSNTSNNFGKSFGELSVELTNLYAFLEASYQRIEKPRKGRKSNYALKVFVSRLLSFWISELGRDVTVDHNETAAYSEATHFLFCCGQPFGIHEETIIGAARAWKTDKN